MTRKQLQGLGAKILKDIATERDGETFDIARLVALAGLACYILMGAVGLWKAMTTADKTFNFQDYGVGFGAICTGVGLLIWGKRGEEAK